MILLGSAFILSYGFFVYLAVATAQKHTIDPETNTDQITLNRKTVEEFAGDITPFMKIPVMHLDYWFYARNEIFHIQENGWPIISVLRTQIYSDYTHDIYTGRSKRISSITIKEHMKLYEEFNMTRSVETTSPFRVDFSNLTPADTHFYIYLWPTMTSFLLTYFLSIGIVYGFLIFLAGCWKFVLLGRPFSEA